MVWHLDEGLAVFNGQMKARFPGIVIGTVGDLRHQQENPTSDHLPEEDGSVDAVDPMIDDVHFTFSEAQSVVTALVQSRDPRIAYIIFNRRIISSTVQPWVWRPYSLADPHTGHIHLSVNDKFEGKPEALKPWTIERVTVLTVQDDVWNYDVDTANSGVQSAKGTLVTANNRAGFLANTIVPRIEQKIDALKVSVDALGVTLSAINAIVSKLDLDPADEGPGDPSTNPIVIGDRYAIAHPTAP